MLPPSEIHQTSGGLKYMFSCLAPPLDAALPSVFNYNMYLSKHSDSITSYES